MSDSTAAPFPSNYSRPRGADVSANEVMTAKKAYMGNAHVYGTMAQKYHTVDANNLTINDNSISANTVAVICPDENMAATQYCRMTARTATARNADTGAVETQGSMTFASYSMADGSAEAWSSGSCKIALVENTA